MVGNVKKQYVDSGEQRDGTGENRLSGVPLFIYLLILGCFSCGNLSWKG